MSIHSVPATERDQAILAVDNYLRICLPGKPLKVEITEDKPERTDKQNRSLWGVAYPPIMEFMGLRGESDKEDLHSFWCGEYWGWVTTDFLGKKKQHPVRTTTHNEEGNRDPITIGEMIKFWDFIQQRAAEHGICVPAPDPGWRIRAKIDAEEEARAT